MMSQASKELRAHCSPEFNESARMDAAKDGGKMMQQPTGLLSTAKFPKRERKYLCLIRPQLASTLSPSQLYARNRWSSLKE